MTQVAFQDRLVVPTLGRGFVDVTAEIAAVVAASGVRTGICSIFIQHTSASLVVQENADPAVLRDLERWLSRLAPESSVYEHDAEGPDDMPAHLRTALTQVQLSIPVIDGEMALGTWQGFYLFEHRRRAHRRSLALHIAGV